MRKIFRVTIERTESCEMLVAAESSEEAEKAVEKDDPDNYWWGQNPETTVSAYEAKRLHPSEKVEHAVLNGTLVEVNDDEYQEALEAEASGTAPPHDDVTLPLFKEQP
jgi:hypothetical protein